MNSLNPKREKNIFATIICGVLALSFAPLAWVLYDYSWNGSYDYYDYTSEKVSAVVLTLITTALCCAALYFIVDAVRSEPVTSGIVRNRRELGCTHGHVQCTEYELDIQNGKLIVTIAVNCETYSRQPVGSRFDYDPEIHDSEMAEWCTM